MGWFFKLTYHKGLGFENHVVGFVNVKGQFIFMFVKGMIFLCRGLTLAPRTPEVIEWCNPGQSFV